MKTIIMLAHIVTVQVVVLLNCFEPGIPMCTSTSGYHVYYIALRMNEVENTEYYEIEEDKLPQNPCLRYGVTLSGCLQIVELVSPFKHITNLTCCHSSDISSTKADSLIPLILVIIAIAVIF